MAGRAPLTVSLFINRTSLLVPCACLFGKIEPHWQDFDGAEKLPAVQIITLTPADVKVGMELFRSVEAMCICRTASRCRSSSSTSRMSLHSQYVFLSYSAM